MNRREFIHTSALLGLVGLSSREVIRQSHASFLGDAPPLSRFVPSGIEPLDAQILGLPRGSLVVLAAPPGGGKTSMAVQIATTAAVQRGLSVAYYSLGMSREELLARAVRSVRGLTIGQGSDRLRRLSEAPLWIHDTGALSATTVARMARHLRDAPAGLDLLVLDYLQVVTHRDGYLCGSEHVIAGNTYSLYRLAEELNIPVLLLSQLPRRMKARPGGPACAADLLWPPLLGQMARAVLVLRRGACKPSRMSQDPVELVYAQASGSSGIIPLLFDPRSGRFSPCPGGAQC